MFEANMDEYLDEETESIKISLQDICKAWSQKVFGTYAIAFVLTLKISSTATWRR